MGRAERGSVSDECPEPNGQWQMANGKWSGGEKIWARRGLPFIVFWVENNRGRWTKPVHVKGELFTGKARRAIVIVIFTLSRQRFTNGTGATNRTDLRPCVAADKNVRAPGAAWSIFGCIVMAQPV